MAKRNPKMPGSTLKWHRDSPRCEKQVYTNIVSAQRTVDMLRKYGTECAAYHCSICGKFHVSIAIT